MDRSALRKKTTNTHRQRTDRFVPPRESIDAMRRRKSSPVTCNNVDVWYSKYLQQKKYTMFLDEAFGLEPLNIQNHHTQQHSRLCPARNQEEAYLRPWPCIPRDRKLLSSADSILDLPRYSLAAFPELLDWSNDNILVAALGRKYHKWSWRTQGPINQGVTKKEIFCCKFHPRGEMLALGTQDRTAEIHDNMLSKCVGYSSCECSQGDILTCSVTAVEWSPTGNSYVIGCSRGMTTSYSRNSEPIRWRRVARNAILFLRVSPDARYIAVAAVNSDALHLLCWPSLEPYSVLDSSNWTIKSITWHPWRSALLAVGAVTNNIYAQIGLWDAPAARFREYNLSHKHYYLDAMLFSHRTGELVVSLWNSDPGTNSQLVVMSDPDTAVDQWGEGQTHLDRVRTMVFSPDGTKLATATSGEDLIIWNFLPEDNKMKKKTKCKKFFAIPVYLDETSNGYSLR
ncbi:unnamed protein product [Parnassius mnemosyne]|uniref:Cortex n=1 Tax=Parnassius mnemosyne TaxID=213953 RepID=A0AAV1LLN2_9NEOP